MLHGYNVEEIFARRFLLVNLAYRFPIWPGQDRVHLQLLADYARVDHIHGHGLPRSGLAAVGASLSVALTKRITLVVGYGWGTPTPESRDTVPLRGTRSVGQHLESSALWPWCVGCTGRCHREGAVLWTIAVILLVLWELGLVNSYTAGGLVHPLLVIAVIVIVFQFIAGRRSI